MALSPTDVGPIPVAVAAGAALVAVENVGDRPLRFVVGEAADEAAPSDLGAGHLLQPGERETVRLGDAAYPLWAWSAFPTRIGISPRLA